MQKNGVSKRMFLRWLDKYVILPDVYKRQIMDRDQEQARRFLEWGCSLGARRLRRSPTGGLFHGEMAVMMHLYNADQQGIQLSLIHISSTPSTWASSATIPHSCASRRTICSTGTAPATRKSIFK